MASWHKFTPSALLSALASGAPLLLLATGCGQGTESGESLPVSDPARGSYAGRVIDEEGRPVAGAWVSADGIAAAAVTDADGNFLIHDTALATAPGASDRRAPAATSQAAAEAATIEVAAVHPAYDPARVTLNVAKGERATVELFRSSLEPALVVTAPAGEKVLAVAPSCREPSILVRGHAFLRESEGLEQDLVVAIDRSGSSGKEAFDLDGDGELETVLAAEIRSARCLLEALDPASTRVSLLDFNDEARLIQPFTSDLAGATGALDHAGPAGGGTNFEAAFSAAEELFRARREEDAAREEPAEDPPPEVPPRRRVLVFLSDGIPTAHGVPRDRMDSNLTQSEDDRLGAIGAAAALGEATGARIFAYSLLPAGDTQRTRTTLPHCVAAAGGGRYELLSGAADLEAALCRGPLAPELAVEVRNLTAGGDPLPAEVGASGAFQVSVPVTLDAGPRQGLTVTNTLEVTLRAFSGAAARSVTRELEVRLTREEDLVASGAGAALSAQAAPVPVSELDELEVPGGGPPADRSLHEFLLSEYEDAVEFPGAETFQVVAPQGGGGTVTLQVDFVLKEACYRSDFGYVAIDPGDPPPDAAAALAGATNDNVFFNTDAIGQLDCSPYSIPAGNARVEVQVPEGAVLAFFVIPNRRLEDYQANPDHWLKPLFTIPALNPGGFVQALVFRSERGRTEAGASEELVTPGPRLVVALEDLSIARWSDQDFSDAVFSITAVEPRIDALECD